MIEFRIRKYPKGYVSEVQKRTWYGRKHWTHFVSVSGMPDKPWYHADYDCAWSSLKDKLISDAHYSIIKNY